MFFKKKLFWAVFLLCLILYFFISNPRPDAYLQKISIDYGLIHGGTALPPRALQQMGESEYSNYLVFSTFKYKFGNIHVKYFGIMGSIYFRGSGENENTEVQQDIVQKVLLDQLSFFSLPSRMGELSQA